MRHCGRRLPAIFFNPLQPLIALLLRRDMTKPVIRTAQVKDLASIQSIYAIEVREYTATFEITPPDVEEMTIRWRHIADTGLPYLVAELDGEIVGYAYACSYRSRSAYSHTVEDSVYVARDKHRQGLGRALLTEGKVGEDGSSVSRILDETNQQLDEPEGNRRRNAIAHLRAAVAATRADRILGGKSKKKEEADPYREDLATVVRPRRPQATAQTPRPTRPDQNKPAPLKLVAEQRIDRPEDAAPIRPRRVSRKVEDVAQPASNDEGFAEYAERVGATDLAEMLEAAAAYMSFVEGQDAFSRPQLMAKMREADATDYSREDRLRSFGTLLCEGKIAKLEGGKFAVSDNIGFQPKARAAG